MLPSICLPTHPDRPPVKIALLIDSLRLPAWAAEAAAGVLAASFVRVEVLATLDAEPDLPAGAHEGSRWFRWYTQWDRRQVGADRDPLALVDCADRFAALRRLAAKTERAGGATRLSADAVEQLRRAGLDVILYLGRGRLAGGVLGAARRGLWRYQWSDRDVRRGAPAYFWETQAGEPLSGAELEVVAEDDRSGQVLCKAIFATDPGISQARTGLPPYWAASSFALQKLHELHAHGWEQVAARIVKWEPRPRTLIGEPPKGRALARWLGPAALRKISRRVWPPAVQIPLWRLAIRSRAGPTLADEGPKPALDSFTWIDAPRGRFYADPFLLEEAGKTWLFFEDADLTSWRGVISAAEVSADGRLGEARIALERSYHLSYPHLVRQGRDLFMLPETRKHGTIEVYRCDRFPDRWQLAKELYAGPAVDTTVWIEHGVCWFFVTFVEPRGGGKQLWLFSSDSLTGVWRPHPKNPISLDVRTNRGAGAIFRDRAGRLIRPSQDGSGSYGRAFRLHEIVRLTTSEYEERTLVTVEPPPGFIGTHSYGACGRLEVIDGLALVPQRLSGGRPPEEAR